MSERRTTGAKLNPTLFDKLISQERILGRLEGGRAETVVVDGAKVEEGVAGAQRLERFNETALRATIKRELNWLLNTTRMEALQPLDKFPQVKTSVLNFGVPDMTGRAATPTQIQERCDDLRDCIASFEPRIAPASLVVRSKGAVEKMNAVSFVIEGDVVSAVKAMPVQFVADVEADSSTTRVRD